VKSVNLLPADFRATGIVVTAPATGPATAGGPAAYFLLGGLALAVATLIGFVLASNSVEERKAELAEVTASQVGIRQQVAALKPYADYRDVTRSRVASVRQLATSRFDWERALRDVSRTLPAAVTLESIDASLSSGQSESSSALRGAIEAPAIQLIGCTSDQREVARMMARLRGVDGVTRVTLSKSQKAEEPAGTSSATPAAAAEDSQQQPCGRGNHPTFDVVIFFEREAALSAVPGGQATHSAAGDASESTSDAPAGTTPTPSGSGSTSASSGPGSTTTSGSGSAPAPSTSASGVPATANQKGSTP
jgi:Tfp pilus assembly protein PilN